MILFADSSAFVKLYLREPGTDRMRTLAAAHQVAVSSLAYAELHATFARRKREGSLTTQDLDTVREHFEEDWKGVLQITAGREVLAPIPTLCERHPLRGADAVHLASALLLRDRGLDVTFACSDQRLLDAAGAEGLAPLDPAREA